MESPSMELPMVPQGRWEWLRRPEFRITLIFSLAFYFLIRIFEGVPIPQWPYQPMLGQTAFMLICLGMMGTMWMWHRKPWAYYLLAHMFAFGFGAATMLVWQSLPAGPFGVVSDAWFNTAIVTKHRFGHINTDFAYKGLHSFYPSLYQFVVGKLGQLTGTTSVKAMKYGFYWVAYLLPLVTYAQWRKLLPQLPAFLMVVVAMTMVRVNLSFKTYEVISLMVFIPWALYYVGGVRLTEGDNTQTWEIRPLQGRQWLLGGVIGGLCFMVFYYYFFLLILWLPLMALVELKQGTWAQLWQKFKPMIFMFATMMGISLVYWLPLLLDMAHYGMHSYQNRWFQPHMLGLPFDFMESWKGMLSLGLVLAFAPRNKLAQTIVVMFVALIGYLLLGHLGLYKNFPLLHVRMVGLEHHLLHVGIVLGIFWLVQRFREWLAGGWDKAIAVAIATVYAANITMLYNYEMQHDTVTVARAFVPPPLLSFPEFSQMANGKVLLTNRMELVATRPIYTWICPNAHYSHPASRYRERVKLLTLLQQSRDSDFIAWMLQHNKYDRVEMVLLDGNKLEIGDDNFPYWPNHNQVHIQFDSAAFRGQYFERDSMFAEITHPLPVPVENWKTFDKGQQRLAALFSDIPELQATIPPAEMAALRDEIRIQTRDYVTWKKVFWMRWMQVE